MVRKVIAISLMVILPMDPMGILVVAMEIMCIAINKLALVWRCDYDRSVTGC